MIAVVQSPTSLFGCAQPANGRVVARKGHGLIATSASSRQRLAGAGQPHPAIERQLVLKR